MLLEFETYYKLPKSIFEMRRNGKLSLTAFDIIILFLDRSRISKLIDEKGEIYFIYTVDELMEDLNIKNKNCIINAIAELEKNTFIKKKRRYNKPTKYYIL